ncbi:hypothetical protein WA026_015921 [Henosepilachna vigintioctopunctata]|uniref:Uncharacterized protein n=1 Tax=Henosepilachna vigintioctopunctata TaxID=420089 RepID=A0AAW1U7H1_9CUCU
MKFLSALFISALFVGAFGEEDAKKVDKRHVVVGVHGFPWPVVDYPFYHHYYHHLLKRDTSAHSIHKREAVEENKPKSQEKRDLVLGYGAYPYYSSYPYFTGYPYFNYYNRYGLFY